MTEEQVFLAALDLADPAAITEYLNKVCGRNTEFRAQVEALLAAHLKSGEFLDKPAAEQLSAGRKLSEDQTQEFDADSEGDAVAAEKKTNPSPDDDDAEDLYFLSKSTRPDSLGRIGHYEVLEILGKGGFGIVFRAFDDVLQRVVAVKVMAPALAATSPARKRFLREARSSAQVRHPNVVQVYAVEEQPLPYLVMEFIPGETLQQRLDRTGPLEVPVILRIGRQIAEGLAAAHETALIHRDIKPSNMLIESGSQERLKITDFGLARAADDASLTRSGVVAGTPMYMSPEQAKGESFDHRADLFSLGSVMYVMAAGRPPFRASTTFAVLKRVAEEEPRPIREVIPEVPQWLCGIIAKLHAKDPAARFQTAQEVADLLADCEAKVKAQVPVKNVVAAPRVKPAARKAATAPTARTGRKKWVAAAAAVVLLSVIALAATEFAGLTHLFHGQQPVVKVGSGPTPPLAEGWVSLFNGKDLSGWKTHDLAPGNWRVEDGAIVGRGDKSFLSFLFSESEYADFHLRAEAKINAIGDSGVFFRAPFDVRLLDGGPKYRLAGGYEAQIAVRSNYSFHTGSLFWVGEPPFIQKGPLMPHRPDEWFVLEVIAQGNRIQTFVNGKKTVDYVDEQRRYDRGHLALQTWGENITFVQFRRIEIKELPSVPVAKPEPLPTTYKNSIGMEFVIVPKGKSWLGGGKDKLGDKEVEIKDDFYLGKYEVTQEEWTKVMGENPSWFSRTGGGKDAVKDISDTDLKRFPVENVSWDQCQIFVAKLNKLEKETGWGYRLPTEVEWEYACRGGPMADKADSAFDFYFAKPTDTLLPEQANFNRVLNRTCKVGSYKPNVLGLHDMHGNAAEWRNDEVPPEPHHPKGSRPRVYGGGGWDSDSLGCRAMNRITDPPSFRNHYLGLRLARVPATQSGKPTPVPVAGTSPFLKPIEMKSEGGATLKLQEDNSILVSGAHPAKDSYTLTFGELPTKIQALRLEVLPHSSLPNKGPGRHGSGEFVLSTIKAQLDLPKKAGQPQVLKFAKAWADNRTGDDSHEGLAIDNDDNTGWKTEVGKPHFAVFELAEAVAVTEGMVLRVTLEFKWDGPQYQLGCFRLSAAADANAFKVEAPSLVPFPDADIKRIAALPAAEQIEEIRKELKKRNPGFDGLLTPKIEDGIVTELSIDGKNLTDVSPVRALVELKAFSCISAPLSDLSPLKGMKLASLDLGNCQQIKDLSPLKGMKLARLHCHMCTQIQDLSPLKGMPLTYLNLHDGPKVVDLEPLKGMPLTELALGGNGVKDFSPLKGMKLNTLSLSHCQQVEDLTLLKGLPLTTLLLDDTPVRDLSPLKGMPLKLLYIDTSAVTDVTPLQGIPLEDIRLTAKNITKGLGLLRDMKSLKTIGTSHYEAWPAAEFWARFDKGEFTKDVNKPAGAAPFTDADIKRIAALPAAEQIEEVGKELKKGNPKFDGTLTPTIENGAVIGLKFSTEQVTDISAVRALIKLQQLDIPGNQGSLIDLSPLKGMTLTVLRINDNKVVDLTPLKGMPLKVLALYGNSVSDLSPLKDMPLKELEIGGTKVQNLSALAGMKLEKLVFESTTISDLSPLKGMKLNRLNVYNTLVSDLTPLKGMPLENLNIQYTKVSDLTPLKGMPLLSLNMPETPVTDLSPLKDLPLKSLKCDFQAARDAKILQAIKTLETINGKKAGEFWKEVKDK